MFGRRESMPFTMHFVESIMMKGFCKQGPHVTCLPYLYLWCKVYTIIKCLLLILLGANSMHILITDLFTKETTSY